MPGNRANRGERETEREWIRGREETAWVDFDGWLKSTPEYF
jgi:hypothetical protein